MTETIICECGKLITGTSQKHTELNLKNHKKSKIHKELMRSKKIQQDALNRKNKGSESND